MPRSVLTLTTAPMGAGKSYMRCASFLLDVWLAEPGGVHYSNYPINYPGLIEVAGKKLGVSEEEVRRRVVVFPAELVEAWSQPDSVGGPWEFFGKGGPSLRGAHIAMDEAHHFVPRTGSVARRKAWHKWVRELRHDGATVELLTQNYEGLDKDMRDVAEVRLKVVNSESKRDPFFGIEQGDWYELKSKAAGEWCPTIWEVEEHRIDKGWKETRKRSVELKSHYFTVYDSFSSRHGDEETEQGELRPKRVWELKTWPQLLRWFVFKHFSALSSRFLLVCFGVWLLFLGGLPWAVELLVDRFGVMASSTSGVVDAASGDPVAVGDGEAVAELPEWLGLNPDVDRDLEVFRFEDPEAGFYGLTVGEVGLALAELESISLELEAANKGLENVEAQKVEVVGLAPGRVYLAGGVSYQVGESFEDGPLEGRRIVVADVGEGFALLDDGRRLRLRVPEYVRSGGGGVARGLARGFGGVGASRPVGGVGGGGDPRNVGGVGNGSRIGASNSGGSRGQRSLGRGIGRSAGEPSGGGATGGRGAIPLSSAARGGLVQ